MSKDRAVEQAVQTAEKKEAILERRINALEALIVRLSDELNEDILAVNFRIDDLQSDLRYLESKIS